MKAGNIKFNNNLLILGLAFAQGILSYLLYRSLEQELWPSGEPVAIFTIIAGLVGIPLFYMFVTGVDEKGVDKKKLGISIGIFSITLLAISAYSGYQQLPIDYVRNINLIPVMVITLTIAVFKAMMYTQEFSRGRGINYSALFFLSWRNFLLLIESGFFALLCIGILTLWSLLFDLIDVTVFKDVFLEEWFLFPAATTAFGFGVIIFRQLDGVIDSITRLLRLMIRFLLPVLSLIAVMFILFLPFTGLQPLWDTNMGSAMMLWLQALLLFSVNAVYQAGDEEHPYPILIHRLIYAGIAVLPLYSIIAFHGIFTRISQYGLTVSRCWAVIVALILCCFAIGYLWSIFRLRDSWLGGLEWVNIRLGLFVMVLLILVNSPVLNLQSISANNQIDRLQRGYVTLDTLDINYFRYQLGRQGYLALENLKQEYAQDTVFISRIERMYEEPDMSDSEYTIEYVKANLSVWPEDRVVPDAIIAAFNDARPGPVSRYYAIFLDLNGDGVEELFTVMESRNYYVQGSFWSHENAQWVSRRYNFENYPAPPFLDRAMEENAFELSPPRWNNLRVGETLMIPADNEVVLRRINALSPPVTE